MVSIYIALYLFLAGTGGCAFLIGSVTDLVLRARPLAAGGWFSRVSAVTDAGLAVGPALVGASALFLLLDLGVPEKALCLFTYASPSLLSMGAWGIVLFCATACGALALGILADNAFCTVAPESTPAAATLLRALEMGCTVAATVLAAFVAVYSGAFLSSYPTLPFLNTPLLPILFVASSMATGLATLIAISFFRQNVAGMAEGVRSLLGLDLSLVVAETAALTAFLVFSALRSAPSLESTTALLIGPSAPLFWGAVVTGGLLVPFAVDVICRKNLSFTAVGVAAATSLTGGLCLRIVLLMTTQRLNLATAAVLAFWC